jgi:hypothetical protein
LPGFFGSPPEFSELRRTLHWCQERTRLCAPALYLRRLSRFLLSFLLTEAQCKMVSSPVLEDGTNRPKWIPATPGVP